MTKRMMGTVLVMGLLAAGPLAREASAQTPEAEEWMEPGDDLAGDGPLLAHGGFDDGPDMGFGMRHGRRMHRGMRAMHRGMGFGPVMAQELGLTAEQQDKIKAARERQERRAIQARADIQLARLDLRKLAQADKPDQRAIDTQIDKISGLEAGLQKSRMATMLEIRSTLTPDQQKKLKELRQQGPRRSQPRPKGAPDGGI